MISNPVPGGVDGLLNAAFNSQEFRKKIARSKEFRDQMTELFPNKSMDATAEPRPEWLDEELDKALEELFSSEGFLKTLWQSKELRMKAMEGLPHNRMGAPMDTRAGIPEIISIPPELIDLTLKVVGNVFAHIVAMALWDKYKK